jgi:pimeloyl-ACP methyl ester carboxylesterase
LERKKDWDKLWHSMQVMRLAAVASVLALSAAAGAVGGPAPGAVATQCKGGATSATIAGKHVCLKAGARCTKRLDRAYHRYRFHCHTGRLTRFPPSRPAPGPPVGTPPTLADPPAPTGRLVDVGGYRLFLECVGTGTPTIVIEAGSLATRLGYRKVQYALSAENRVCTYDRPGTTAPVASASDPRPESVPPTSETFARELYTVLVNGNVPGPYLLAGNSLGGLLISAFTARHLGDVVGLVFVDAEAPGNIESWLQSELLSPEPWDGRGDVGLLRTLTFGSRPVVVVTTQQPGEIPAFRRGASNIVVAQAPQFGHIVFSEAPGLAYEAIRVAVAAVRAGGALPPCAQTQLPKIGARCEG